MNPQPVIQRSFGAGELAPALHARADQSKYVTGLRTCKNWIVRRSGGVVNRPGTRFIGECKTASPTVKIIPYISEIAGDSLLLEMGAGYIRFYKDGALVTIDAPDAYDAGTHYVIGDLVSASAVNYYCLKAGIGHTPVSSATYWYPLDDDVFEVPIDFGSDLPYWSQSGRTITLTHQDHAPQELTCVDLTTWVIKTVVTSTVLLGPTNVVLTPGAVGTRYYAYKVTAVVGDDYEESETSALVADLGCAEPTADLPNSLTWTALANAKEYYVYCDPYDNGTFGYVGTASGTTFKDPGFVPDFTVTPPVPRALFATEFNYPNVSATYQQRRFFGYTAAVPDAIFASRVGFPSNFGISSPLQDDDSLTFRIAGRGHNPIRHLVGLKQLAVLTDGGVWLVQGGSDGVLAPNAINAEQETYAGCAPDVPPVVIGNAIIYLQARGSIIRDVQFSQQVEGLDGRDLTLFASHLVDGHTIVRLDYAETPDSVVWAVRDDGILLGMTYVLEQDAWGRDQYVAGWHWHDTHGWFDDVCVVPEDDQDGVYVIVRRTIDEATVRYIERFASRQVITWNEDVFFVDAGLSRHGSPVDNVTGLDHLNGEVVAVVGDGEVIFDGDPDATNAADFTVTGGTLPVDLPASYTDIHVGLRIAYPDLETLDLDVQGSAVRPAQKRVSAINVILDASSRSFYAGPDVAHLRRYTPTVFESLTPPYTGQVELSLTSTFNKAGRVLIRQTDPLPIGILAVIPNVELGG
jgi:hypothetical protein